MGCCRTRASSTLRRSVRSSLRSNRDFLQRTTSSTGNRGEGSSSKTARRVLEYTGGTLVMPMTVLVESCWREISDGLTEHGIPSSISSSTPTRPRSATA